MKNKENNRKGYFPKELRCSDGSYIPDTAKNWEKYLRDPDKFQEDYIIRVRKWIQKGER